MAGRPSGRRVKLSASFAIDLTADVNEVNDSIAEVLLNMPSE